MRWLPAAGEPFHASGQVANRDRAVGARIAGELAILHAAAETPLATPDIRLDLQGTAGQSFGAFAVAGMHLALTGQANDFVGKGLSGGTITIRARGLAAQDSSGFVILGNVSLYGATSGKLFAAGRAGERFAVRNSGAIAVVEGVGDHGCEYMTGGTVAVLGAIGMNFGAGMTGGIAWVYDKDGAVRNTNRFHADFLKATPFCDVLPEAQSALRDLLEEHVRETGSSCAQSLLNHWGQAANEFLCFTPLPQA